MTRAFVFAAVLGAPLVAAADPAPKPAVEHARLEIQPPGRPIAKLSIENPLGDVRVEGYDGNALEIETRKQAPDDDSLDRLRITLVPNPDGTVRIATGADPARESHSIGRGAVRVDIVIRAPRGAYVVAGTGAGALEVLNMDAGGDLDSASGTISVRNVAGELQTHSVSGKTKIEQVFGAVDAQTLSADVDMDSIGGRRLVASANKGTITGRRVRSREIELTTIDGDIMLDAEAALRSRLILASIRGNVDVHLRRHGAVVVRARGVKVDLLGPDVPGAGAPRSDGWIEQALGAANEPALVEARSKYGTVRFTVASID